MAVRLRPHHLLCLLTYVGKGYSPKFIDNFNALMKRLNLGEKVLICSGPDEICSPLLKEELKETLHCLCSKLDMRDRLAAVAISKLMGYQITPGKIIAFSAIFLNKMRQAFKRGQIREACIGCQWWELCTSVASSNYTDSFIRL